MNSDTTPETRWKPAEAKSGFARAALPESFLVSLYRVLAPYRGCAHGCRYCDGRAEKYYVEGDFERDILARTNLSELVASDIASGAALREFGSVCIGSGVTDVYQPLERELELTRKTLEALVPAQIPVVILTKSDLILRDFDLLAQFPKALVICTVTTANPEHAAILEPGASSPAARLEVVRKAKEAGFSSGIMAMPLCPGITATDESLGSLLDAAEAAGADFVYPGGLTLRPGRQKDLFVSVLDGQFPELRGEYDRLFAENRPSGMPLAASASAFARDCDRMLRSRGIPQMIPHSIYRDLLSPADSLFVLFCHLQSLFALRGVDTRPLKAATDRYAAWLKAERTALRRKRIKSAGSDPFPDTRILADKLACLCGGETPALRDVELPFDSPIDSPLAYSPGTDAGEDLSAIRNIEALLGNRKLAELARSIVIGGAVYDYPDLSVGRK